MTLIITNPDLEKTQHQARELATRMLGHLRSGESDGLDLGPLIACVLDAALGTAKDREDEWLEVGASPEVGRDHLVLTSDLTIGRLRRKAGDALCKPKDRFWGLIVEADRKPNCKRCLELAARHQLALPNAEPSR